MIAAGAQGVRKAADPRLRAAQASVQEGEGYAGREQGYACVQPLKPQHPRDRRVRPPHELHPPGADLLRRPGP
ncbi:MAG: hypothetical protein MZU95_00265 [Desulfomicrobium escambiense]|nr:hypothetical protein [Desulfomicrobium escambiense]